MTPLSAAQNQQAPSSPVFPHTASPDMAQPEPKPEPEPGWSAYPPAADFPHTVHSVGPVRPPLEPVLPWPAPARAPASHDPRTPGPNRLGTRPNPWFRNAGRRITGGTAGAQGETRAAEHQRHAVRCQSVAGGGRGTVRGYQPAGRIAPCRRLPDNSVFLRCRTVAPRQGSTVASSRRSVRRNGSRSGSRRRLAMYYFAVQAGPSPGS